MEVSPQLKAVLNEMGQAVGSSLGTSVHSLLRDPNVSAVTSSESTAPDTSLHVSLTHPLPLRRPLNETFARQIGRIIESQLAFVCSLVAEPKVYYNQPKDGPRRAFLALRTGAGTPALHRMLERIETLLKREHLPLYHSNPEFHTSFAWWLDTGKEPDVAELREISERAAGLLKTGWKTTHVCVKVAKDVTRVALL